MRSLFAFFVVLCFVLEGCEARTVEREALLQEWREQHDWDVESRTRARLFEPAVLRGFLIGKSRLETIAILGQPDVDGSSTELRYKLGTDPNFGVDFWELRISFDGEELVSDVAIDSY